MSLYNLNFYISGMILISYLIYSFINKEFLAFTLSKDYWMSLFSGVFLGSVVIRIMENEAFFKILFDLPHDAILGIIFGIIFSAIFVIIFSVIFLIIFGVIKEYNRNLTRIEIKSTRKLYFINLYFMLFMCLSLSWIKTPSVFFGLMLILGSVLR